MQSDTVGPRLWCKVRVFWWASSTLRPFEYVQIKLKKNIHHLRVGNKGGWESRFLMHGWAPECCMTMTRCDTKDSDAWSKLNQTPRNEEYGGRLWWGHTRLNRGGIKCNARLQGGYHGNLSSQPRLPQQAPFESHALVVLFVGGKLKIVHQRRKSRRKRFRRRETKKNHHDVTCKLTCRAPRWRLYSGSHGLWWRKRCRWEIGHLRGDSAVSADTSMLSVCLIKFP